MIVQYVPLPLTWTALKLETPEGKEFAHDLFLSACIERRLTRILGEWERTPYDTKFSEKQVGSSCAGFICRVLDELYGRSPTELLNIPNDISFHNRNGAMAGLKWFLQAYPEAQQVTDMKVQPGDIIITQPEGGGPGHALIVGPRENTMWQTTDDIVGVHYTGLSVPSSYQLSAVFRFTDREKWA